MKLLNTQNLYLKVLGTGQKDTIETYKKEFNILEDTNALIEERVAIFDDLLNKNMRLMSGAKEILEHFKKKGTVMAIATGGHTKNRLNDILNHLKIREYFSVLAAREAVKKGKPDPAIYLFAAKKLKIDPKDCLVLEDAPNGVIAGKKAGMHVIGIGTKPIIRQMLQTAGADRVFTSLSEIQFN